MSDPPRRRRSTPPPSRRSSESSSLLPTVALGVGVVVAGLGIGAFLSAMQHRGAGTSTTSATTAHSAPVVTPVARPTRGPVAFATVAAHPTASPTPRATPVPTPTPQPSATPAATATPRATASPRPTRTPTAAVTEKPTPRATATPRAAETKPLATPTPRPPTPHPATPRPTPTPTPAPVARATPLTFGGIAQNTVRRYLSDLIAGNENAAYAELGKPPGSGGLSEEAFIDRGTRITSVRTTTGDANGATVEVELTSSRGSYFATYHVTNGPSGPVIDQHDYIKV